TSTRMPRAWASSTIVPSMSYPEGYHCAGGGYVGAAAWGSGDVPIAGANALGYVTYPQAFLASGITTSTPASLAWSRGCWTPSTVLSVGRLAPGSIQSARCGGACRAATAGEGAAAGAAATRAAAGGAPNRSGERLPRNSEAAGRPLPLANSRCS